MLVLVGRRARRHARGLEAAGGVARRLGKRRVEGGKQRCVVVGAARAAALAPAGIVHDAEQAGRPRTCSTRSGAISVVHCAHCVWQVVALPRTDQLYHVGVEDHPLHCPLDAVARVERALLPHAVRKGC